MVSSVYPYIDLVEFISQDRANVSIGNCVQNKLYKIGSDEYKILYWHRSKWWWCLSISHGAFACELAKKDPDVKKNHIVHPYKTKYRIAELL